MKLGEHSAFSMPESPDYEQDGFKWWGIKSDVSGTSVHAAYVQMPSGEENYVLLNSKGVFYETKNLEGLFVRASVEAMLLRNKV